jgi:dolichol-phosphate mannosyltransferase
LSDKFDLEVIFVDDGSTDGTGEALKEAFASWPEARVVKHEVNRNLGAALKTGFATTTGDYIFVLDSDCTYPPTLIGPMLARLQEGYDIVTVSPWHPKGGAIGVPAYRQFLSRSLSRLFSCLLGSSNYTFTAMVRAYKREVVKSIPVRYANFVAVGQVMVESILAGYRVADYPTQLRQRRFGASKMKTARVVLAQGKFIGAILWPVFQRRVLRRRPAFPQMPV